MWHVKRDIRQLLKKSVPVEHRDWSKANDLIWKFQHENNIEHLIRLYTLQTPFCGALQRNVESFATEIYRHLSKLDNRAYKGRTHRGLIMSYTDLHDYYWAVQNKSSRLIEIKTMSSTSIDRNVAECFTTNRAEHDSCGVMCIFDFPTKCITAINLCQKPCLSAFEDENEVLVLPGILFEVKGIQKHDDGDNGRSTIILSNISVSKKIIMTAVK
ncbi:unnamed protein product, partial [Didymodactylos carnosus]